MKKLAEVYKMSVLTNVNPTFRSSPASIKKKKRNTYRYMTAKHRIQGSLEIFVCKSLWQVFN